MNERQQRIAVSGVNGQLGQEIRAIANQYPQFEFLFLDRDTLDLGVDNSIRVWFDHHHPDYFINCAAYTAVDKAETEKDIAVQINAVAPGLLAAQCREKQCRFVHLSTDYVFDGNATRPYREDDTTAPTTVYGLTKVMGEQRVMAANPNSVIIRTSWVYSAFGKNFMRTMLRLFAEKQQVNVVADQVGTPTNAADLARAILAIITSHEWKPGIYHYSNEGIASWYDFARAIAEITGSECSVNPITTDLFPTPAKRPAFSVLDKQKIRDAYGITIPAWKESLAKCLALIKKARQ